MILGSTGFPTFARAPAEELLGRKVVGSRRLRSTLLLSPKLLCSFHLTGSGAVRLNSARKTDSNEYTHATLPPGTGVIVK